VGRILRGLGHANGRGLGPASGTAIRVYATWNPLDKDALIILSDANLTATRGTSADGERMVRATIAIPSGKSYFEIRNPGVPIGTNSIWAGLTNLASALSGQFPGSTIPGFGCQLTDPVNFLYYNGSGGGSMRHVGYPPALSPSWFHFAVDRSAGKIWVKHANAAGVWAGGGDPVAGTSPTATFTANSVLYPAVSLYSNAQPASANFGATAFTGTVPSGFQSGIYT
jgi:hypothetical protein